LTADKSLVLLDQNLFDALGTAAHNSSRKRQHHNLHESTQESAQRFLNALEPDSYVRPHRHVQPDKAETLLILRGKLGLLLFDAAGAVIRIEILSQSGHTRGGHIPAGIWHGVLALEPGTVVFEVKNGPYRPADSQEHACWAPAEGSPDTTMWLARMRSLFK